MLRLGGEVVELDSSRSSALKGETLEDTIKTMENFVDVIVMRHPETGSAQQAADVSAVPVLNAGDGAGTAAFGHYSVALCNKCFDRPAPPLPCPPGGIAGTHVPPPPVSLLTAANRHGVA